MYEKLKSIPLVHCAGTKGKGTTCAMAETLLRSRGYKTGLFTSPHFNSINERIRINGKPISEEELSATFEKLEKAEETEYLRCGNEWFSYLTLIALQSFVEQKVDVVILEVGIGGQLCSTSQYPMGAPRVCCISALGYDHLEKLGYTIEEIAAAKAGIFRHGATLITTWQEYPEAYEVLVKSAKNRGELLTPSGELIDSTELEFPQNVNAASAVLAVRHLMKKLKGGVFERLRKFSSSSESDLMKVVTPREKEAIQSIRWPGRQQILEHEVKGRKIRILLDAAHTPESMKILSHWAAKNKEGETLILMKSARGRDIDSQMVHIAEFLKPDYFAGCPTIGMNEDELDSNTTKEKYSHIFPDFLTASKEDQLKEQHKYVAKAVESAQKYGLKSFEYESINDCLENMPEEVKTVIVTGSIYMVAAFFRLRPDASYAGLIKPTSSLNNLHPWHTELKVTSFDGSVHFCGGVIIDDEFILTTTEHCCLGSTSSIEAMIGGGYWTEEANRANGEFSFKSIFVKPRIDTTDACLVKIPSLSKSKPATCEDCFGKACLPIRSQSPEHGQYCWMKGSEMDPTAKVGVNIYSESYCTLNGYLPTGAVDFESEFCAGEVDLDNDGIYEAAEGICTADRGSPLICDSPEGTATIFGLLSKQTDVSSCSSSGYPAVFVDVSTITDTLVHMMQTS
ncbi:Oidioi.mRNA.OKI2018_I69.PAR.g8489.t1.cds [Oikopleura dioica]|uniref:tetrahydrofolate synthase n=1 Tax=Oikopleura dioica TaxID=34765 RepID=A0ABN7RM20_OIKDI|nr:Oidioi.mRNA.OKI2018_I69.PAR.g8489.t1.cds [Oikopleura dioica]